MLTEPTLLPFVTDSLTPFFSGKEDTYAVFTQLIISILLRPSLVGLYIAFSIYNICYFFKH